MAIRRPLRPRRSKNEMNVVPYIDVMLVLLVIFMVTTPLISTGQIKLPTVTQASEINTQEQSVEIRLDENGELAIRLRQPGQVFTPVTREAIIAQLRNIAQHDSAIIVSADGTVPYAVVMEFMDLLRSHGLKKLGLMVNHATGSSSQ